MKKFGVFLCVIFFVAFSDAFRFIPKKSSEKPMAQSSCNIADAFSASFELVSMNKSTITFSAIGDIYFSYPMKVIRTDIFFSDGKSEEMTSWSDYSTGMSWTFIYAYKKCYHGKLNGTISPPMIPTNAELVGHLLLGDQQVESWQWEEGGNQNGLLVTRGACTPVSFTVVDPTTQDPILAETFGNFVPSVNNILFQLPSECTQQKEIKALSSASGFLYSSFLHGGKN